MNPVLVRFRAWLAHRRKAGVAALIPSAVVLTAGVLRAFHLDVSIELLTALFTVLAWAAVEQMPNADAPGTAPPEPVTPPAGGGLP